MYGYEKNRYNDETIIKTTNNKLTGSGLLFDTNLTKDDLLNYRASIGFEQVETFFNNYGETLSGYEFGVPSYRHYYKIKQKDSYYRYGLLNTLGFGLFRNDKFRLWFGPEFGINYKRVTFSTIIADTLNDYYRSLLRIYPKSYWVDMLQLQLGISFGVNINLNDLVALSLQSGLHAGIIIGINTTVPEYDGILPNYTVQNPGDGSGYGGYVRMSAVLKFNE